MRRPSRLLPFAAAVLAAALAACGPDPQPAATDAPAPDAAAQMPDDIAPDEVKLPKDDEPLRFQGTLPGDLFPNFRAAARRPAEGGAREETLDTAARKEVTVYVVASTTCSYCNHYAPRFREVEDAFLSRGVDVVYLYPNRRESEADKVAWHDSKGLRGAQVIDADASIAQSLGADRTPTAFVVDPFGVIVYRGGIDDAPEESSGAPKERWLRDAIDAALAGKAPPVESTEPAG